MPHPPSNPVDEPGRIRRGSRQPDAGRAWLSVRTRALHEARDAKRRRIDIRYDDAGRLARRQRERARRLVEPGVALLLAEEAVPPRPNHGSWGIGVARVITRAQEAGKVAVQLAHADRVGEPRRRVEVL